MTAIRLRQRRLLQGVVLALLAVALVPTLSRALTQMRGKLAPWDEVCSSSSNDAGPSGGPAQAPAEAGAAWTHVLEHCPLCALQLDGPDALPVAQHAAAPVASPRDALPMPASARPTVAPERSPAHARAPPTAS